MNTNYMLDAFTLRTSTNYMHMVLIMDAKVVKEDHNGRKVHHVSY